MWRNCLWVLAHCFFLGCVSGIVEPTECKPVFLTTTVFVSTTIYTSAPSNVTTAPSSSSAPWGNITTTADSSSVGTTTSIPFGNTTTSGTSASSSVGTTSSAPFVNTTSATTVSSTLGTTSFGNTTTSATTVSSSLGTTSSIPFGNTTTSSATSALPTATPSNPSPPWPSPQTPPKPFRGFKNAVYFTNWGVNSGFHPQELPVSELTHILYAFADIDTDGTVKSSDPVIDLDKRYPGDSHRNFTKEVYGAVKQLYIHKKYNRNLKTILSVGGWNYSPKFAGAAATDASRHTFAASAVKLVTDWGFDGIDLDWEYPVNEVETANFVKLLEECRREFDKYSLLNSVRYHFSISVASPASPVNYGKFDLVAMDRYVDTWNLMSYDYSGSWDTVSGHQANVFAYGSAAAPKKPSTDEAVRHYRAHGIASEKILMGLPVYGRAFEGTAGLGQNYSSVGEGGPQPGVWYYRDLPKPGAEQLWDDVAKATYSYDPRTREFISYDDIRSTTYKAHYLQSHRLGGAFFWEASGDKAGGRSLINTMSKNLDWLDENWNNLYYPTSQYRNIRRGMPDE